MEGLPHLYGFKWYAWARAFFNSKNRMNLLCAANQISKSSTQIRRHIADATDQRRWPMISSRRPRVFWQLYPSRDVATAEWNTKWLPEFMPRGKWKDDPTYGWRVEYGEKKKIHAIHWNSGIVSYWKTYEQDVHNLQSGTVDEMFCDEELPEDLFDELKARLFATNGPFNMVFTATRNQELWYRAMECRGDMEKFPDAFKQQISAYDCLVYDDGTPSPWSVDYIRELERGCKSVQEALRRIHGRFVQDKGRKYPQYDPIRHYIKPCKIPSDWKIIGAIDKGGGKKTTKDNHYSAIVFLAVAPNFQEGYVVSGWRGDGIETTSQDVLDKFIDLRGVWQPMLQIYPHDAKDFGLIATSQGEPFTHANKSHALGEDVLNTLFRSDMLKIFDTPELNKLGGELMTLMLHTPKDRAKDDLADALRYAAVGIPWDWSVAKRGENDAKGNLSAEPETRWLTAEEIIAQEIADRRGEAAGRETPEDSATDVDDECGFWNDHYGT